MKLSVIIRNYRMNNDLSQREFAKRCGLSNSYVSFIEKELNPKTGRPLVPTLEQYGNLARGMGMSIQSLFELLDEDSPVNLSTSNNCNNDRRLTPDETHLVETYRSLPAPGKQYVQQQLVAARLMYGEKPADSAAADK